MDERYKEIQKRITSEHLRNGNSFEVWLITYFIFTTLIILLITVMVVRKILRNSAKKAASKSRSRTSRDEFMTSDSSERLSNQIVEENENNCNANSIVRQNGRTSRTSSTSSHLRLKMSSEISPPPREIPAIPPPSYTNKQLHTTRRTSNKQPDWLESFENTEMPSSVL